MKTTSRPLLMIASCLFACLVFVFGSASAEPDVLDDGIQTWEHLAFSTKDASIGGPETARQINQLGDDGWELVDVTTIVKDGSTDKLVYCFKRPK